MRGHSFSPNIVSLIIIKSPNFWNSKVSLCHFQLSLSHVFGIYAIKTIQNNRDMSGTYCKSAKEFSFLDLPLGSFKLKKPNSLTIDEFGLLKQLYYNKVVYPVFIPWQSVHEFSLSNFCICLPKNYFYNLKELIKMIPYCEVFFTEEFICLFARLTTVLVNWIRTSLGWDVHMVRRVHKKPKEINPEWFNKRLLSWVVPEALIS